MNHTVASTATVRLVRPPALDLLYTPLEERFERITRIARSALNVPVAAVTLINRDKQWFKSVAGWLVSELPRDRSLCSITLAANELSVIDDTTADPRTADHPLVVRAPHFRFYGGYPLNDASGLPAGTFCVFDLKPRTLSWSQRECMADLAALAERELANDQLRDAHTALTAKLGAARREAMIDPLTRLWNRRGAMLLLESAVQRADRTGAPIGLALLDLDNFKQVNDTLGHKIGDEVLRRVAARIVAALGDDDFACRLGGDEFLLMIDGDASATAATSDRVRLAIHQEPLGTRDGTVSTSASAGFTVRPAGDDASLEQLIELADRALMQSKTGGRNRVSLAS